jgi:hypothetical protein
MGAPAVGKNAAERDRVAASRIEAAIHRLFDLERQKFLDRRYLRPVSAAAHRLGKRMAGEAIED